ncbi:MAG: inner membrane CreD family protein, partial [Treponema sp.]|nr:inner membrane CreD family protein [Treponema sp.]
MKNSKHGVGLIILFIGIIVLILSIGLLVIRGLLSGRQYTYYHAVNEINSSAGGSFSLSGLEVKVKGTHNKYSNSFIQQEIMLNSLDVQADLKTDVRKIGIYSSPIFTGQVIAKGKLIYDLDDSGDYTYSRSDVHIYLKAYSENLTRHPIIKVNGKEYTAELTDSTGKTIGISCSLEKGENDIEILMDIRGAGSFSFDPIAGQNTMTVNCDWTSPNFTFGKYLPDYRDINENGFTATWNIPFPNSD